MPIAVSALNHWLGKRKASVSYEHGAQIIKV